MTKSHYRDLSNRWRARHQDLQKKLWGNHGESLGWLARSYRQLTSGSLGGLMLLTGHFASFSPSLPAINSHSVTPNIDKETFLISDLTKILPEEVRPLNNDEEQKISNVLSRTYGITVAPELEGKRLNTTYGFIGAEQHLPRYPGDNLSSHFDSDEGRRSYWQQGMTPGLGAWRYFADSQETLTPLDIDREKYYIAVQTFLSKDFNNKFAEYRDFYKYRKMLVVNPNNGKAIIADIADAGPAQWTGKSLGGSPEVMHYLERVDGAQKGPVLYFFINDPDDKVKLGPIVP